MTASKLNLEVLKRYIAKTVKESTKDAINEQIVTLVAKGAFNTIIKECVGTTIKEALKEYNTKVNRTSYTDTDPDLEGIVGANEEPEMEKAPKPVAKPKKKNGTDMALAEMQRKYAPSRTEYTMRHEGSSGQQAEEQMPEDLLTLDEAPVAPQNYDENTPSRLSGGGGDNLPNGDVNPAHLMKMLKENKQMLLGFDDLDTGRELGAEDIAALTEIEV